MSAAAPSTAFSLLITAKLQIQNRKTGIQASMTRRASLLVLTICALFISATSQNSPRPRVNAEMHNVMYHFTGPIAVHIAQLEGELSPTQPESIPVFDDPNSFTIVIRSAKISVTTDALANVLNQYAFAAPDAPIKAVRISVPKGKLKIEGRLHSKGDVAFSSEGSMSVTPNGEIRVHTEKLKAGHLPIKGLMDLLGKTIASLIDTRKVRGLRAEKDDLILTPSELFPPPHIQGQLRTIYLMGNEVVQEYGTPSAPWMKLKGNYMAYHGGELRFGKLSMSNADLVLIDKDAQDPLDFYLDRYKDQLVAGYTKITSSFGLRTYVTDYNKVPAGPKTH